MKIKSIKLEDPLQVSGELRKVPTSVFKKALDDAREKAEKGEMFGYFGVQVKNGRIYHHKTHQVTGIDVDENGFIVCNVEFLETVWGKCVAEHLAYTDSAKLVPTGTGKGSHIRVTDYKILSFDFRLKGE